MTSPFTHARYRYDLSVLPAEFSLTRVLDRPAAGRLFFEEVIRENFDVGRLLYVLREDLGLTGNKEGCGEGECGACTVLVYGEMVARAWCPVSQVAGAEVRTIEAAGGDHPLQRAFAEHGWRSAGSGRRG